jgi:hypothetical protein
MPKFFICLLIIGFCLGLAINLKVITQHNTTSTVLSKHQNTYTVADNKIYTSNTLLLKSANSHKYNYCVVSTEAYNKAQINKPFKIQYPYVWINYLCIPIYFFLIIMTCYTLYKCLIE